VRSIVARMLHVDVAAGGELRRDDTEQWIP
jgi:hypothetical protein